MCPVGVQAPDFHPPFLATAALLFQAKQTLLFCLPDYPKMLFQFLLVSGFILWTLLRVLSLLEGDLENNYFK